MMGVNDDVLDISLSGGGLIERKIFFPFAFRVLFLQEFFSFFRAHSFFSTFFLFSFFHSFRVCVRVRARFV